MAWNVGTTMENTANGYLTEATNVKGGFFVIDNLANLPNTYQAVAGVLCYCTGNSKFYQYDGSSWNVKTFESSAKYINYVRITQAGVINLNFSFVDSSDASAFPGGLGYYLASAIGQNTVIPATGIYATAYEVRVITGVGAEWSQSGTPSGSLLIYYSTLVSQSNSELTFNSTAAEGSFTRSPTITGQSVNIKAVRTC